MVYLSPFELREVLLFIIDSDTSTVDDLAVPRTTFFHFTTSYGCFTFMHTGELGLTCHSTIYLQLLLKLVDQWILSKNLSTMF